MERTGTRAVFAGVSLLLALTAVGLAERGNVEHQSFKAFYCGGVAVRERLDPYRVEPLRSCERRLETERMPNGYVEPAPLPGYVLAPFALLSVLTPKVAATIFALLLAAASILSALALAPSVGAPSYAVLLALTPLTLLNVAYGEIPPFALLAICACASFLRRERWTAAGVAAALALVQPNVGLPAALAVLLFAPRSRIAVVAGGLVLAGISAIALGVAVNVEYLAHVLPLLARAEIVASDQYSLSRLLYVLGAPSDAALLAGRIWFGCAAIAGILVAGRLAAKNGRRDLLALLPPAAVTLFGIYLHDIQVLIALPAAMVLASSIQRSEARFLAALFAALLIAVWTQPARLAVLCIDAAGVFGGLLCIVPGQYARRILPSAAGALATAVAVALLQHFASPAPGHLATQAFGALPDELSPLAWGRYLRATPALTRVVLAQQIVTWIGLLGIFACALFAGGRRAMPGRS
jgi:hypothetical protein